MLISNLSTFLKVHDISINKLSAITGVRVDSINALMNPYSDPSVPVSDLNALAKFFEISLAELFTEVTVKATTAITHGGYYSGSSFKLFVANYESEENLFDVVMSKDSGMLRLKIDSGDSLSLHNFFNDLDPTLRSALIEKSVIPQLQTHLIDSTDSSVVTEYCAEINNIFVRTINWCSGVLHSTSRQLISIGLDGI